MSTLKTFGFSDLVATGNGPAHRAFSGTYADQKDVRVSLGRDGQVMQLATDGTARVKISALDKVLPEGVSTAISTRGIVEVTSFEATPRAYFVTGYSAGGEKVQIEIGANDRVANVSVSDKLYAPAPQISKDRAAAAVTAQGYKIDTALTLHSDHYNGDAVNPYGEHVTLQVDSDGTVSKEQLIRS